jgi:hypothetical protein
LAQRDVVPGGNKGIGGDLVPHGFLAQYRGFRDVFGFNALGDFFFVIEVEAQLALLLRRAPNGLDGIEIGLRNATVVALEARDRLVKVGAHQGKSSEQKPQLGDSPGEPQSLAVERPEQAAACTVRTGGRLGVKECGKKDGQERAAQEESEHGLNIDEVGGASEEFGQNIFHGFDGLPVQSGKAEGDYWKEEVTGA